MKKYLLTLLMVLMCDVAGVYAAEFTYDGLIYSVDDYTHATIIGCENPDAETVIIPYTVNYPVNGEEHMFFVTKIAENAFVNSKMTKLIFESKPYSGASSQGDLVIENGAFATPTLKDVYIDRIDLPVVNGDPFSEETYDSGILSFGDSVSEAVQKEYLASAPWNRFQVDINTSVSVVDAEDISETEYYTISGVRLNQPQNGAINLVRRGKQISKQYIVR